MGTKGCGGPDDLRGLTMLVAGAGVTSTITGAVTWLLVRAQLNDERIVVPGAGEHYAGRPVAGPFSAYAEANVIKRLALEATNGKSYGELDEDDPAASMAKDASLLRASLFTSVLAFGMAAAQMALGGVLLAIGAALGRIAHRLPARGV